MNPQLRSKRHGLMGVALVGLWICTSPLRAFVVDVTNGPFEVFEKGVETVLTDAQARVLAAEVLVETTGNQTAAAPVQAALDTSGERPVLAWLLSGITPPGAIRRYVTLKRPLLPPGPGSGDLTVTQTDDDLRIANSYFEVTHRTRGGGGFPGQVTYRISGHHDRGIHFLDRLYRREGEGGQRGQYVAEADPESTARIVFESPVRVVVESQTRYVRNGQAAPGTPRIVYRYVYTPFSPVIQVTAVAERDDDLPWNEQHFLHLTRDDYSYTSFAIGDPPTETPMLTPGLKSRSLNGPDWALMATDSDAAGVGGGPVTCWDAADEFYYYIVRHRGSWASRRREMDGLLYFGPATADGTWYSRWLSPASAPEVRLVGASAAVVVAERDDVGVAPYVLENAGMRLSFAGSERGFACVGIHNLLGEPARFVHWRDGVPGMWRLAFRTPCVSGEPPEGMPPYEEVALVNTDAAETSVEKLETPAGKQLRFTWRNLDLPNEEDCIDVTATVTLAPATGASEWRIALQNRSRRFGLWEVEYPLLASVCPEGLGDVMQPHGNWGGTLVRQSRSGMNVPYPSAACPVQFMAFNLGEAGLYLAAHDGEARPKSLIISREQDATFRVQAENMGVPGSSEAIPFPVVVAPTRGDWWAAARLYRTWAAQQTWTRKGWIAERDDVPLRLKEIGLWWLGGGAPEEAKPMMEKAAAACGSLPIGLHWYTWHEIPFDHSYPNYFPTKPGFAEAVRALTSQGQVIMPYINGRLWDEDIPSFAETGILGACKQPDGSVYTEVYGSQRRLSPMCPATQLWQDTVVDICHRLMDECGVNAIYLDQIGAAMPRLCFDATHGHPLGGGSHWVDGYRVMLNRIKTEAVARTVALTTENTAEPYMDTIDAYLAWVQRNDTDIPLLPAVYSGLTLYFTSPQDPGDSLDAFAMAQGRDFLWGCQLGWNSDWLLTPPHREKLAFELELCALHLAGKAFMVYGELLDEIRPTGSVPTHTTTWHRSRPHEATLPAVQGTLWRDQGGGRLAVFMVNSTDSPQRLSYAVAPQAWLTARASSWLIRRLTPAGDVPWARAEGVVNRDEMLGPREVRAITIEPYTSAAPQQAEAARAAGDPLLQACAADFIFAETAARGGLTVSAPDPLQTVVRGEPLMLNVGFSAGQTSGTVGLLWPDGAKDTVTLAAGETRRLQRLAWPGRGADRADELAVRVEIGGLSRDLPVRAVYVPSLSVSAGCPPAARAGESFVMPLNVRNNSRIVRRARVLLSPPEGWTIEPATLCDFGPLEPGETRSTLLKCTVPLATADLRRQLQVRLVEDADDHELLVKKSRPCVRAPFAEAAPTIDGDLTDWPTGAAMLLGEGRGDSVRIEKGYAGAADLSADVRVGWDKTFFYLAATVRDNVFFQDQSGVQMWQGDCIQLAFRDGPPNPESGYDGAETEVGLTLSPKGPLVFQWMPGAFPLVVAQLAVQRREGMTVYEAAVPWDAIGIRGMREGRRLAWSLTVNDNDGEGFRGWLEWTAGVCGSKDSSAFGWLETVVADGVGEGDAD